MKALPTFVLSFALLSCAQAPGPPNIRHATVEACPLLERPQEFLYDDGLVWIRGLDRWDLSPNRALITLDLRSRAINSPLADEEVFDIHRTLDNRLWVLSVAGNETRVWEHVDDGFRLVLHKEGLSTPLALSERNGRPVVLLEREIVSSSDDAHVISVPLSKRLEEPRKATVALTVTSTGDAYVGTNRGEFGGNLYRIPLHSGHIDVLRKVEGPDLCDGPLNPDCDPFSAVIVDPDHPECVLAGIGLRHFTEHGRLLRVCGTAIEVVSLTGLEPPPPPWPPPELKKRCEVDPKLCSGNAEFFYDMGRGSGVFALSRTKHGYWMATGSATYYVTHSHATQLPRKKFVEKGGLFLGWAPGVLLMATEANQTFSMSGATPLVAATSLEGPNDNDLARWPILRDLDGPLVRESER